MDRLNEADQLQASRRQVSVRVALLLAAAA
jgi:hypothetical protein